MAPILAKITFDSSHSESYLFVTDTTWIPGLYGVGRGGMKIAHYFGNRTNSNNII